MTDEVVYKLFPEPVFKYKLKNFIDLNQTNQLVLTNYKKRYGAINLI